VNFVLDASVTLAWAFEDEGGEYAREVLARLEREEACTTALWPLEVSNGLLVAERRDRIKPADSARFTSLLLALPIVVEPVDRRRVFEQTRVLARRWNLSAYDAHYLELAIRYGIPLATLDDGLRQAAEEEGIRGPLA
jgi:predicted nucleic acid-binding protein